MTVESVVGSVNESPALEKLKELIKDAREIRVNLDDVYVNRNANTRSEKSYTEESMDKMKKEIVAVGGLLHPIIIYAIDPDPKSDNKPYCLLDGYRRTLASLELMSEPGGEHFGQNVKALEITGEHGSAAQTAIQMLENTARQDLNPMEESNGYAEMMKDKSITQKALADFFGKSKEQISNLLRLQALPQEIQDMISEDKLTFSAARVLVSKIPESSWPEYAKLAVDLNYGEFMKKVAAFEAAQTGPGTTGKEGEADATAVSTGKPDQQRRTELLKASVLKDSYVPFLAKQLEAAKADTEKKFTAADLVQARIDTINAVMVKNSNLGEAIKPFLQEQIIAKEKEEQSKAASDAEESFFRGLVKEVEELHKKESKADPANPGKEVRLSTSIAATLQRVKGLPTEEVAKLGFKIDVNDLEALKIRFTEIYKEVAQERADAAKKKAESAAKKAEEEKKAAEAKAAAEAPKAEAAATAS